MRKNGFKFTIIAVILLVVFIIGSLAINAATPTGTRLKDIQSRVLVGTEFPSGFSTMSDSATFTSTGAAEFNLVTPENAMKWDATEPNQNQFNFTEADNLVSWGQSHGFKIHGHCFVWHNQTPGWVQGLSASAMQSAMNNHIDTVMNHFNGKIMVWDVVNEAFNDDGTYRTSFWYNTLGKTFIENAFIRAKAANSTTSPAKLIYNDYNLEYTGAKSNAAYNMLKDFKTRGIPVDGIGFQMHLDIQYGFNYDDFATNMQRFADLGLEIYITEMDVRISSGAPAAELQTQADYYKGVIQKCMAQPAVKAIQIWGFTDKYSWVPNTFPGRGAALIFDSNYNPKLSYYAVQSALGGTTQNTPTPTRVVTVTSTPTPTPTRVVTVTSTPTPTPTRGATPTPTRGSVPTATPTPTTRATGNYVVAYVNQNDWGTGATINVTITNNTTVAVNGWTLAFTFPGNQTISNIWSGTYTQSGASISVKNLDYNAIIGANGGSVNFGFNMNYSGTNAKPTSFTLNGTACTVQ